MSNSALAKGLQVQSDPTATYSKAQQVGTVKRRKTPLLDVLKVQQDPNSKIGNSMLYQFDPSRTDPSSKDYDPEVAALAQKAKKDCVLFMNQLGNLCISSSFLFPQMFNTLPMTETVRSKYSVIRGLWLGYGSVQRFKRFEQQALNAPGSVESGKLQVLDRLISNVLVEDLVTMAASYYFDTDITEKSKIKQAEATGKAFEPRFFRRKFDESFNGSTYTHSLVLSLAQLFDDPQASIVEVPELISVGHYQDQNDLGKIDQRVRPKWEDCEVLRQEELEECKARILSGRYKLIGMKEELDKSKSNQDLQEQIDKLSNALKLQDEAKAAESKSNEMLQKEVEALKGKLEEQESTNKTTKSKTKKEE